MIIQAAVTECNMHLKQRIWTCICLKINNSILFHCKLLIHTIWDWESLGKIFKLRTSNQKTSHLIRLRFIRQTILWAKQIFLSSLSLLDSLSLIRLIPSHYLSSDPFIICLSFSFLLMIYSQTFWDKSVNIL